MSPTEIRRARKLVEVLMDITMPLGNIDTYTPEHSALQALQNALIGIDIILQNFPIDSRIKSTAIYYSFENWQRCIDAVAVAHSGFCGDAERKLIS